MSSRYQEPLTCPFCGSKPEAKITYENCNGLEHNGKFEFAVVKCVSLECQIKPRVGSTMEKGAALSAAIRRWNIRA